jgi:hypothetical protein
LILLLDFIMMEILVSMQICYSLRPDLTDTVAKLQKSPLRISDKQPTPLSSPTSLLARFVVSVRPAARRPPCPRPPLPQADAAALPPGRSTPPPPLRLVSQLNIDAPRLRLRARAQGSIFSSMKRPVLAWAARWC